MTPATGLEDGGASTSEPRTRRVRSTLVWLLRLTVVALVAVVGLFVWGYFQPKPPGFAPVNPDEAGFVTEEWTRYTIDATSRDQWVFFDLDQGRTVETTFSGDDWDLAFKRTDLLTNSGATNPAGSGGAIDLGEVPLENATTPASAAFILDDDVENAAISDWYKYSLITHTVRAKGNTYLVRGGDDRDALVQFDSYYCEDEDPGCVTFRYRLVPAAEAS